MLTFGSFSSLSIIPLVVLRALGLSDLLSYYLYLVLLFSLTAFSASLLASLYLRTNGAALFTGFVFTNSSFIFGNIDSPESCFFGLAFLSLYYLKRFFLSGSASYIRLSVVLAALQAYLSNYVFMILLLGMLAMVLANIIERGLSRRSLKLVSVWSATLILLSVPLFAIQVGSLDDQRFTALWNAKAFARLNSLDLLDFGRRLPGTLQADVSDLITVGDLTINHLFLNAKGYGEFTEQVKSALVSTNSTNTEKMNTDFPIIPLSYRRAASFGLTLAALTIIGSLTLSALAKRELTLFIVLGMIVAAGPLLIFGEQVVPGALYPLYQSTALGEFLLFPSRFFFLVLLALAILAGSGFDRMTQLFKRAPSLRYLVGFLLVGGALLENVPYPLPGVVYRSLPPYGYEDTIMSAKSGAVLHLPSSLGVRDSYEAIRSFQLGREAIYMNWQTATGELTPNGIFQPPTFNRIELDRLIGELPSEGSIENLEQEFLVRQIVFHKELALNASEAGLLEQLYNARSLRIVSDTPTFSIFEVGNSNRF